jgi:energy-coupling factor transporter ATP-binding protein EcfA2
MSPPRVDRPFESDRLNNAAEFFQHWDVPSIGREASDALNGEVEAVRANPAPSGDRKIHVVFGPSGYGKTHLFGRVAHAQQDRLQFIYVPMTSDPAKVPPVEHVRYGVIEALLNATGGAAPLRRHLARLFAPSFAAYFDQLPDALQARCRPVRQRLETDPAAVLDLLRPVQELAPYQALAESVRKRFPSLPAGVVRALVLGLSPAADDARTWLRGEAESLNEERRRELLLADPSPDATAVLQTVGVLLGQVKTPLLLCLDQLEWLLKKDAAVFSGLTAALMAWLQAVPNLVLVLGCITDEWTQLSAEKAYTSFLDRIRQWKLNQSTPAQAAELVTRRMRSWTDFPDVAPDGWPFDLPSLGKLIERTPPGPRGLLQLCGGALDKWVVEGRKGLIAFTGQAETLPLAEAFLRDWNARLELGVQSIKEAVHYQEAELWDGVHEALQIARLGRFLPEGLKIERITLQALQRTPNDERPSAHIDLLAGGQRHVVVLAVSKKDGGKAFGYWYDALEKATDKVAGAVVVWPKAHLAVGKTAKTFVAYRKRVDEGSVRPFPLDENEDAFRQLETLRGLLKDAESDNLVLNGKVVKADECRKLLVETRALVNLKLFEMLFHNWPSVEAARVKGAPAAAPSPTPAPPPVPREPAAAEVMPELGPRGATAPSPTPAPPPPTAGEKWAGEMLAKVEQRLRAKGQPVRPAGFDLGPTFARLKVELKDDADFARVKRQADNLKLHLELEHKPLIAAQAGHISIDVQRPDRQPVPLPPLLQPRPGNLVGQPAFPVGVDVTGKPHWLNLADPDTCHLLVAGTTGSGKSEFLKAMLAGLAHHLGPHELQLFLIDPKQVTFNLPGSSPYLPVPVVFDAASALPVLEECYEEMERRYALLRARGKEHVGELSGADAASRWVVVFDEFADLMADRGTKRELEALLARLGAKARAAGVHLALGTQRPEASVVTPLLRSNLPGRVSLRVISERDSKLILEQPDAAYLLGKGDLFWRRGGGLLRLQSPLVGKADLEQSLRFG